MVRPFIHGGRVAGYIVQGLPMTEDNTHRDAMRQKLSQIEDAVMKALQEVQATPDIDARWLAIGRTDIEKGFMAAKRALYSGKRVGDP